MVNYQEQINLKFDKKFWFKFENYLFSVCYTLATYSKNNKHLFEILHIDYIHSLQINFYIFKKRLAFELENYQKILKFPIIHFA